MNEAEGKTPFIFVEIEGTEKDADVMLFYGHFDKQPPMDGLWDEGLSAFKPVQRDGKLYGRGGADDGYSIYAVITALKMV